jgi:mRNA-degrading endonuclease HigB of HigAB toxin-antitoxin module
MQSVQVNNTALKQWQHQQAQQQAKKPPDLKSSVSLREYGRHGV